MRNYLALIAILIFSVNVLFSKGNGIIRTTPHFDKLRVTSKVNVYLNHGDSISVRVVANGIDPVNVLTEVKATTLEIGLSRGIHRDYSVDIYITYTDLREVYVGSSGKISFQDKLTCDKITLEAGTNASIDAELNMRSLEVISSNGGSIRLGGKVDYYEAKVRTAGILSALELSSDSVFVSVVSKGVAKVMAKELIEANVRSGGSLTHTGSAKQKKIQTGVGATIIEQ